jgi:indole-3-glycerol phosphate synthase
MGILDRIHQTKLHEVETLLPQKAELQARAADTDPPKGFRMTLAESPKTPSLIAEVKKASPSKGLIRPDFDPAAIAAAYRNAGASCLSVLTDREYFQGDPSFLALCRAESGLPCLRKDFVIHPVQVVQARALHADAVLLIMAMLSDAQLADLAENAFALGMDVLLEVHDEIEASRVPGWANLVGVNNRSLQTFEEDLSTTGRLASLLQAPDRLFVSESSLHSAADVRKVAEAGARAVLIGTSFCAAPDVEAKVREVMDWPG